MLNIEGSTLSQTIRVAFQKLAEQGTHQPSRNGGNTSLYNTFLRVDNPRSRHLHMEGRKSNIFQLIAETFWVMAGADVLSPYLSFFLPRALNYSDDGQTWHGAYGPRMYNHGQLPGVIETFKTDGKMTRRAQISIYDASLDSPLNIADEYGVDHKPKDIPCNSLMYFYVTPDDKFHLHVTQRSGDLLFGTGSINPFEFSVLQELVFNEVKKLYPEIELGYYSWYVNNAHVYDAFKDQLDAVLISHPGENFFFQNNQPLLSPSMDNWEDFFMELLVNFSSIIATPDDDLQFWEDWADMNKTFKTYGVSAIDNLLYEYALMTLFYIHSKRNPNLDVSYDLRNIKDQEVKYAILNSGFRKFKVIE